MARIAVSAVNAMMAERPGTTLEAALDVFEVFASGSLSDEIYILEDVAGKRIAIAPTVVRDKYRRGGFIALLAASTQLGAGGPGIGRGLAQKCCYRYVEKEVVQDPGRLFGLAVARPSPLYAFS